MGLQKWGQIRFENAKSKVNFYNLATSREKLHPKDRNGKNREIVGGIKKLKCEFIIFFRPIVPILAAAAQ